MKLRKYYPTQVLRRLTGHNASGLDPAHYAALTIGMRRARKSGIVVSIINDRVDVSQGAKLGRLILNDIKTVATGMQKGSVYTPTMHWYPDEINCYAAR